MYSTERGLTSAKRRGILSLIIHDSLLSGTSFLFGLSAAIQPHEAEVNYSFPYPPPHH
jgi:hypothetical protein